jgi:hypothetical protein
MQLIMSLGFCKAQEMIAQFIHQALLHFRNAPFMITSKPIHEIDHPYENPKPQP